MDVDTAVRRLRDKGFLAAPDATIRAIADSAGAEPSQVRVILDDRTAQ
jgi:hypothetical protein